MQTAHHKKEKLLPDLGVHKTNKLCKGIAQKKVKGKHIRRCISSLAKQTNSEVKIPKEKSTISASRTQQCKERI